MVFMLDAVYPSCAGSLKHEHRFWSISLIRNITKVVYHDLYAESGNGDQRFVELYRSLDT